MRELTVRITPIFEGEITVYRAIVGNIPGYDVIEVTVTVLSDLRTVTSRVHDGWRYTPDDMRIREHVRAAARHAVLTAHTEQEKEYNSERPFWR